MIVKEELDGIDIDDIGNLEDLPTIVFIHEECGNIKVFVYRRELTGNINKKKKPGVLLAYRCPLCDKCKSVVNNLKEKKLPAQVNRNRFDLILASRYGILPLWRI